MKKKIYAVGLGLAFMAGGLLGSLFISGNLQGASPGGPQDPVVTVSYLDMRLDEIKQMIPVASTPINTEAIISEILADITNFFGDGFAGFAPVFVNAGSIVLAGEGTEIILRSGQATAHVPGADGIVNATAGNDIFHNAAIAANNLYIIPRQDGRGIAATTDAWFIIRGDFDVVTP